MPLVLKENDGQAFVEVTNDPLGAGSYNFIWSNPDDNEAGVTSTATQLSPGENFVIVTDGTCATDTFPFMVGQPSEIMLDFNNTVFSNTTCKGDCNASVSLEALGGTSATGNYNYLWEDGSTDATRNDLCAGQYSITISDDNNCEKVQLIEIMEPDTLLVRIDSMNVIGLGCSDDDVGQIPIVASGGCGNFTYEWENNISNTNTASGLGPGIYNATVTDDCGCSQEVSYELLGNIPIVATPLDIVPPLCPR